MERQITLHQYLTMGGKMTEIDIKTATITHPYDTGKEIVEIGYNTLHSLSGIVVCTVHYSDKTK